MTIDKLIRILWALRPIIGLAIVVVAIIWSLIWALNQPAPLPSQINSSSVSKKPSENTISSDKSDAKWQAKGFVELTLKAPSTAAWPNYNNFAAAQRKEQPDVWDVMGYVDSQNSYGAMIRTNWQVAMKKVDSSWVLLEIDMH